MGPGHDIRVCAVIVSYRPDIELLRRALVAVRQQVQLIVLIDNGSSQETVDRIRELCLNAEARLIPCGENLGVAGGHNLGILCAREQGCSHVLLLDQDSVPAPDMMQRLWRALNTLSQSGVRVAGVGPQYVDEYTGSVSPFVRFGRLMIRRIHCSSNQSTGFVETDFLITSGSLIPIKVFDDVGLFEIGLFIDHVDTEWVLRVKHKGYKVFGVCGAVMHHSLGSATFRFWFFRWRNVPLHSPERHYYVFRNSVVLFRRPYAPRQWVVNGITRLVHMSLFYPIFAPQRLRRIRLMLKGLRHGFLSVQGPLR